MTPLSQRLLRIDAWLNRLPWWAFALLASVAATIKAGPYLGHNFRAEMLWDATQRPDFPAILLDPTLTVAVALRVNQRPVYELLAVLVAIVAFILTVALARRYLAPADRWISAFVLLGPIGALLIFQFGRYDTVLIVGALIYMLAYRGPVWLRILGAVVMAFGNPGQALAGSFALLLVSQAMPLRSWRQPAAIALAVTAPWFVAATLLGQLTGASTQASLLRDSLQVSLEMFVRTFPALAYSVYGIGWLLVIGALLTSRRSDWLWVVLGAVALPLMFMAITTDGTRVGIGVGLLPILALGITTLPMAQAWSRSRGYPGLAVLVLLALVFPTPEISHGQLTAAWSWTINEFAFWVDVFMR